jgi:hypothetical protein
MPRIHRVILVASAVAYAVIGSGCIAMGSAQKADTMGKGNMQFGIEPGAVGASAAGVFGVVPDFNASFRFGLTDTVDLGLRAGTTLLELGAKFLLTDPSNDFLALSLAPSLNGIYFGGGSAGSTGGGGAVNIQIPLLVGIKFGSGSELVVGPRINNSIYFVNASSGGTSTSSTVYALTGGASLGVALQLTDFFGLMPEVAFMVPLVTSASGTAGGTSGGGTVGPQQGVAFGFHLNFLLGRGRSATPPPSMDVPPPPPLPGSVPPPPAAP